MSPFLRHSLAGMLLAALLAANPGQATAESPMPGSNMLPNGRLLDPAGASLRVGNLPFDCALSPDGHWLAVLHGGQRNHGVTLVDTATNAIVQTLGLADSYHGLAWAADGTRLYVSGGSASAATVLTLADGKLQKQAVWPASGHVAGLAVGPDGVAFMADDTGDRLVTFDAAGHPVAWVPVSAAPFALARDQAGDALVSGWAKGEVTVVGPDHDVTRVKVGSHPTAIAPRPGHPEAWVANANDDTVSVLDTRTRRVVRTLKLQAYAGAPPGVVPTTVAFSPDGATAYVALAGANAVAVLDPDTGRERGRIPTAWYPSAIAVSPDGRTLYVSCAKGFGMGPRRGGHVWQMAGAVMIVPVPDNAALAALTRRSNAANHFDAPARLHPAFPPIHHVVYVVRENRSYDQELGDVPAGDGDPRLVVFGRKVTPNAHAIAERFAFADRFFCDGEVSAQGHMWLQGAICTDADERMYPPAYAGHRADMSGVAVIYPDTDFLLERCVKRHVSCRDYGEALRPGAGPEMKAIRARTYKGWDLSYSDLRREAAWEAEFKAGIFPAFSHVWFPNDHTYGTIPGKPTPRALVADNDAATGRLLDTLSHDPRWKDTLVIIQEDDAQGGYDHVDGHRSVLLLASPWVKGGRVTSCRYSQVSVVATVAALLGLGDFTQYDARAPLIDDIWRTTPDMRPYQALPANFPLSEHNTATAPLANALREDDFDEPDDGDQALLARALWLNR